jgi:shikimate kinase
MELIFGSEVSDRLSVFIVFPKKKEQSGKVNIERVNDKSQIYGNVNRFNILQVFLLG